MTEPTERAFWQERYRIILAFGVLVLWALITLFADFGVGGEGNSLEQLIASGVGLSYVFAIIFLIIMIAVFRWRGIGYRLPRPMRSLWLLWMPVLYMCIVLIGALAIGLPPSHTLLVLFINSVLVGISEETMFRGVLFSSLRTRFGMWPSIIIVTICFGIIHVLNVLVTGALVLAAVQAVTAALNGLHLMALRLRTRSIFPAIVVHALWDFLLLSFAFSASRQVEGGATAVQAAEGVSVIVLLTPVLFILPLAIYGAFLLRHIGREDTGDRARA